MTSEEKISEMSPSLSSLTSSAASEQKKHNDIEDHTADEKQYCPIKSENQPTEDQDTLTHSVSLHRPLSTIHSVHSYGDGHGFTTFSEEEGNQTALEDGGVDDDKNFIVTWDGDNDPEDPRNMSSFKKYLITILISMASLCVTCASSIYTSTYKQIEPEFDISREVATLGLSLFVMGLGIGPLFLSPLSEVNAPGSYRGLDPDPTMLVARFLDGVSGSAFLSVAGGTIGDLFRKDELNLPMMIYSGSPFLGPEIGPIIAGFINTFIDWRWTFYVQLIWAGTMLCSIILFVPETYHPVLLRRRAQKRRLETGDDRWRAPIEELKRSVLYTVYQSCYRPFMLLLLEPMCLNLCLLSALVLGIVYLFFGAFALIFENNHGFNLWQVGLAFLGMSVGMLLGMCTNPIWVKNYDRLCKRHEETTGEVGGSEPEFRLPPAIAGAICVPIGLLWFGWTTYASVHWIVPIIGSTFFGAGVLLVFSGVFTFLVDAYPLYAASALAANSFTRSSFAAGFPLFGVQMYNKLGYQWATFLLACLADVADHGAFPVYLLSIWKAHPWKEPICIMQLKDAEENHMLGVLKGVINWVNQY
ncbi:MAG: hypothetical protein M1834_003722 [Cirrosporium novae-zelandiae]|nr:MAG: hypothetical protein M1834_003722 [Cirrosporium novae-zelandiae]